LKELDEFTLCADQFIREVHHRKITSTQMKQHISDLKALLSKIEELYTPLNPHPSKLVGKHVKITSLVVYGQDGSFFKGNFPNVTFRVHDVLPNNIIVLSAPGFGEKTDYGNGKIFVNFEKFHDSIHVIDSVAGGISK